MPNTDFTLCTIDEATRKIGALSGSHRTLLLEVREDKCFLPDQWLSLGQIEIFPYATANSGESETETYTRAVQNGSYTWRVPLKNDLVSGLRSVLGTAFDEKIPASVFEAIQDVTRRLSLLLPTFDGDTVCAMPFRRPTTLVIDTSSVLQGALDFACRFLYPMARIKIPAVVPLEILNMADRFLTISRKAPIPENRKGKCLQEHIKSQGGQRALLRLEWHANTEVERPIQNSDPLRMIFERDTESSVNQLNLSVVQRSFADRLIFETAKEHQARQNADHAIGILTSDQGLARMALSEGMQSFYFEARKTAIPLGRTLTGTLYHPFEPRLYSVPLTSVLWELATCFGNSRLRATDGDDMFQATAMDEGLIWFPYQSKEDLLWCSWQYNVTKPPEHVVNVSTAEHEILEPAPVLHESAYVAEAASGPADGTVSRQAVTTSGQAVEAERIVGYVVSPAALFRLVGEIAIKGTINKTEALNALQVNTDSSYTGYRSFLVSGQLVEENGSDLTKLPSLDVLWRSITHLDYPKMQECLSQVPSLHSFLAFIAEHGRQPDWDKKLPMRTKPITGYTGLAEICTAAIRVPNQGICLTTNTPPANEFAEQAFEVYSTLATDAQWVLTGLWLEQLAWIKGIHPVIARRLLKEAYDQGFLVRFFAGSTPEIRFTNHTIDTLEITDGAPTVRRYALYQGDFIEEGEASVRIRLERRSK